MYESFTGRPPFLADSMFKVVMKHLSEEPKPITAIDSGQAYVASINAIVMKCLQKDPLERYSNVEQVRADLLKVLTGGSVRHDFKPIAIEQSSATQGSGTPIKLMPMAMEVSLHGFNLRQWAVIAAAFIFAFWLFRQVPHGGLIAIIAMIMVGSCTAAVVKGLALHSLTWWRSRLGLPIRLAPAYLPGVIINSIGTASDTTTKAKPSLIYRKFSRRQVAALPEERKHQLSLALVSLLPDLGRMQFFCSSFQDEGEQETQGDCYVVSSSPPGDSTTPDLLARQFNRSDVALNTVRQEESHSLVLLHSSGRCSQKDSSAASEDLSVVDAKELEQQSRSIKLDAQYCTSMTFTKLPAQVYFGWLKTLLDLPCRLALSVHMEPLDEVQAKKARQTQRWNQQLQLLVPESNFEVISNQPVNSAPIDVSIYVCVYADTIEQLNKDVALIQRTAGNLGGLLEIAEYRQADCFVSSLPLAHDQQKSRHRLLPSEAAALIPFE
jgi:hypothetical protein